VAELQAIPTVRFHRASRNRSATTGADLGKENQRDTIAPQTRGRPPCLAGSRRDSPRFLPQVAFRNTRYLIFAAMTNGAFIMDIDDTLDLAVGTIHGRLGGGGRIATVDFA
jgi:hypothetical protein